MRVRGGVRAGLEALIGANSQLPGAITELGAGLAQVKVKNLVGERRVSW